MDQLGEIERVRAALPALPAHERRMLTQFLTGSNMTFSHACDPRHRDAYRLFCGLIASGESANPFCDRCIALLAMMQDNDSFEEFRELVSTMRRGGGLNLTLIFKLAATDSFRRMFRQLLHDGWLQPREEDAAGREMMKLLHAQFAYQEGSGPKPLCAFGGDGKFVATLEEDGRVLRGLDLHGPEPDSAQRVEDFFAERPGGTWKQASDALDLPVQTVKRLRKKAKGGASTLEFPGGSGGPGMVQESSGGGSGACGSRRAAAGREPQETRAVRTSMSQEALYQTAYTQITFAGGAKAILPFEPSERGRVLWAEWAASQPFPAAPADMDRVLRSRWGAFAESAVYQSLGPETPLGQLLHGSRVASMFGRAERRELYRHGTQRELYELACPWYSGGAGSARAARRIGEIGRELYELGADAADLDGPGALLGMMAFGLERTGRLPDGFSTEQFTNARRMYGSGHAAMMLHFIGIGLLTGVFDEVTNTVVPAARHSFPATSGGIVKMHHTKNLRGELEITGWQCVVEMLWHGIGQWMN